MQNTIYRCLLGVCIYTVVFLHLCASLRSAGLNKETTYLLTYLLTKIDCIGGHTIGLR